MLSALALSTLLFAASPANAAPSPVERGEALAKSYCGGCHAVGRRGSSPRRNAPAFRDLHKRYKVSDMEEALGEGIITGHPEMPEIRLWPEEVADFITYLESIQTKR